MSTDSRTTSALQELGDALDLAEATIPALHRLRSRFQYNRPYRFPSHPAVTAYRDMAIAVAAYEMPEPPTDPRELNSYIRMARKDLGELREIFENKCAFRGQPGIEWPDGGKSVSLRVMLDVYADMMAARRDLERLLNLRAGRQQQKVMEQRAKLRSNGRALVRAIKQTINRIPS